MENVKNDNAKKFFSALPLPLIMLLAIILLGGGALLFIYSFVIIAAWKSAMAFLVVFGGSAIALGAGLGAVNGFIRYLAYYNKKTEVRAKEKEPETKVGKKKIFSLGNIALAIVVMGSVSALISAALGSIERESWLEAKTGYMQENGYFNETKPFQTEYYLPPLGEASAFDLTTHNVDKIVLDLNVKNAVVIYDNTHSQRLKIRGYMKYNNQIAFSMNGSELTVSETPSPKLDRVKEKMLFFLFKENEAERQIRIILPSEYKGIVEIKGDFIEAKE